MAKETRKKATEFTSAGTASGSWVAAWMPMRVRTASGSIFAGLKSAAAVGLGLIGVGVASTVDAAAGGMIGHLLVNGVKREIPFEKLKEAFGEHDKDSAGVLSYEELVDVLNNLGLKPETEELRAAYKSATGHNDERPIKRKEFYKLFGITFEHKIWKEVFNKHDRDSDGLISYEELEDILLYLELNPGIRELQSAYKSATGNDDKQLVGYEAFLKIITTMHKSVE